MPTRKVSRNEPCPCGSGKKYKRCCYGKDVDWSEREQANRPRPILPRPPVEFAFPGVYGLIDRRLQALARATPERTTWKTFVEHLSEATTVQERLRTYQAVREARLIPEEAGEFLVAHAIQWMPGLVGPATDDMEAEHVDEEKVQQAMDEKMLALLWEHGSEEMAKLFASNRLEYDRRHERGRRFFYGPPEEELARQLRAKGIIG